MDSQSNNHVTILKRQEKSRQINGAVERLSRNIFLSMVEDTNARQREVEYVVRPSTCAGLVIIDDNDMFILKSTDILCSFTTLEWAFVGRFENYCFRP